MRAGEEPRFLGGLEGENGRLEEVEEEKEALGMDGWGVMDVLVWDGGRSVGADSALCCFGGKTQSKQSRAE